MCVTEIESASGGHLHAFDKRCAQRQNMKNAWFGALGRGYIGAGLGVSGWEIRWEGCRRGASAMQAVRPVLEDGPPKAPPTIYRYHVGGRPSSPDGRLSGGNKK